MQITSNYKSFNHKNNGGIIFNGIARPEALFVLHDSSKMNSSEDIIILERYFSDIQNLFLKKLSAFAISDVVTEGESVQLRALLEEMIKVKQLIQQRALGVSGKA